MLLGAGYGLCLSTGLREVEEIAAPDELGAVVSIYYSLAYTGLLVPYLLTFLAPRVGYPWALTIAAGAAALSMLLVLTGRTRFPADTSSEHTRAEPLDP